jgi:Fe-S-cluster containining protein
MSLEEKVRAVESIFQNLDNEIASFQSASGLHCKFGCGQCCFKPDIEATILEFLPFALYLHQAGKSETWLQQLTNRTSSICLILNEHQKGVGLCSQYAHRGLICRLFGYSARTNKYGQKELVTCSIIKKEQAAGYREAQAAIDEGLNVPVMNHYYMQLHAIDFELTRDFFPINVAIRKAIETVMQYYAYR